MAPRNTSGASYVKAKLQESDHMGKVEASAAALLSECSAVLIRKLVASTPPPLSLANLKRTIQQDNIFQCFRSAFDDFQPVQLPASFLSAHLKQQGRVTGTRTATAKRKRKNPQSNSSSDTAATAAAAASRPSIAVKAMEDVDQDFAARIEETATGPRGKQVIEDDEDYD